MRAFTFHCFTRGDLTLLRAFCGVLVCLFWLCVGVLLFVVVLCFLFGLPLTILRSGSCLPEQTTVGAVMACAAWEKKKSNSSLNIDAEGARQASKRRLYSFILH